MIRLSLTLWALLCFLTAIGQQSAWYEHDMQRMREQRFLFQADIHHASSLVGEHFQDLHSRQEAGYYPRLSTQSEQYRLISELLSRQEGALEALAAFAQYEHPNPELNPSNMELGNYFYNKRAYQKAVDAYSKVHTAGLNSLEFSEYAFKKGYCHFVKQEFAQAARLFDQSKAYRNIYYYPTNYYSGMCSYFQEDYDGAISSFEKVTSSTVYRSTIPYYITQIYFVQGKYDQMLTYGEQSLRNPETKNQKEIKLLLGQAYFKKGNYNRSLPYLEYYEENSTDLSKEEFYQIAFTQYQLGYYEKAIDNFLELTLLDDKMGQVASYYLADCYQRTGDVKSARSAYKKVSQMGYNTSMQREAQYNYGKLSAELGYDREAINTLVLIESNSPYYESTQDIINDLLATTDDYGQALSIIEGLPSLTEKLKATYQELAYKNGIKAIRENNYASARQNFEKVATYPKSRLINTETQFWLAKMLHNEKEYLLSIQAFDDYFDMSNGLSGMQQISSPYVASYTNAYNYLKLKDYNLAGYFFKNSIVGINLNREQIDDKKILNRLLPDAFIRAGDCYFKLKDYAEAKLHYQQSIDRKQEGYVYALYQRGLIEGLEGEPYEKILSMEDIVKEHADHAYADDALMQLGDVYLTLDRPIPSRNAFVKILTDYRDRKEFANRALLKLGLIAYNQGDVEAALDYYKRVFAHQPSPDESQAAILALEEIYVEDLGETQTYFDFLKTIPGYEVDAFTMDSLNYKVGLTQYEAANYKGAIQGFDKYLDRYESGYYRHNVRYYRGESYAALKQYSKALADYEAIVSAGFNPYYVKSVRKAAILAYNHTKRFDKAYTYYDTWAQQNVADEDLYQAQLGALRSAYRVGSYPNVARYRSLLKSNALATRSEKVSADYYLAKMAQKEKQYEEAIAAYQSVSGRSRNAEAAEANYRIAEIEYGRGNLDKAEAQCNVTNSESSGYPYWIAKSLLLMGDIYMDRDDLFNARAAIEAVVENFDDASIKAEAQAKLDRLRIKEAEQNRIKENSADGTLELDTTNGRNK